MRPPRARKPEVMSPGGHWPQVRAAIEAGADAVYFGMRHFTARAKVGFERSEIPDLMRLLHQRGVRGYVTFNTLIFEDELHDAAEAITALADAGVDALIVQDYAAVRLARDIAPSLELHASTQMSITNAEGVAVAQQHGIARVTLARELSIPEIRSIYQQTGCELEVFVHGALCVAYSGQCFSSEAWGGRSANRGQCAQACRLPYELLVDGEVKPLGDARYLLSPEDLFALRQVPELIEAGVSALKIEGRYKDAEYVAATTRAYREAVDAAWAGRKHTVTPLDQLRLEQVYSRGMGAHFLTGTNHQNVVKGRAPRHRGVLVGTVSRVGRDEVWIAPSEAHALSPIKPGDGIVFDAASWRSPNEEEEGGRIYEAKAAGKGVIALRFGNGAVDFSRIRVGDLVWRTDDPEWNRQLRSFTESSVPIARKALHLKVRAVTGLPLRMEWSLRDHPEIAVTTETGQPVEPATRNAATVEFLEGQCGRLGGTPYYLETIDAQLEGNPFLPASLLNTLRRDAVERLQSLQAETPHRAERNPNEVLGALLTSVDDGAAPARGADETHLHLLVRTPEQLEAALPLRPSSITLDYLDLYGLKPSVERVRHSGVAVRVATPRVLKPGEEKVLEFLLRLDCPLLIRATGMLEAIHGRFHRALTGDFSLNVANTISARTYLSMGLDRLTPTHDLNAAQITELAVKVGARYLEVIAYQHLPVFHTEHCVFCRFLSQGTSYKDCGRPCENHVVSLRDAKGRDHPLLADTGCRNTVFGAEAQHAASHLENWVHAGLRHFRLEFAHESGEQVRQVTTAFRKAIDSLLGKSADNSASETGGRIASWLEAELAQVAPQGLTQGSLFIPQSQFVSLAALEERG